MQHPGGKLAAAETMHDPEYRLLLVPSGRAVFQHGVLGLWQKMQECLEGAAAERGIGKDDTRQNRGDAGRYEHMPAAVRQKYYRKQQSQLRLVGEQAKKNPGDHRLRLQE